MSVSAGQGGSENLWRPICLLHIMERDAKELFQGLDISKDEGFEKYLNQYDVIKLDMTTFRREGESAALLLKRLNTEITGRAR